MSYPAGMYGSFTDIYNATDNIITSGRLKAGMQFWDAQNRTLYEFFQAGGAIAISGAFKRNEAASGEVIASAAVGDDFVGVNNTGSAIADTQYFWGAIAGEFSCLLAAGISAGALVGPSAVAGTLGDIGPNLANNVKRKYQFVAPITGGDVLVDATNYALPIPVPEAVTVTGVRAVVETAAVDNVGNSLLTALNGVGGNTLLDAANKAIDALAAGVPQSYGLTGTGGDLNIAAGGEIVVGVTGPTSYTTPPRGLTVLVEAESQAGTAIDTVLDTLGALVGQPKKAVALAASGAGGATLIRLN